MTLQYQTQRVAVFIDTANLYHTTKYVYKARAAFSPILETAIQGRSLIRAIAYTISTEGNEEKGFIDNLISLGIEIKSKELIKYRNGDTKGDWDIGIAVDAIAIAPHVDVIVLITGDGDFAPLVKHLKSMGVFVEAVTFEQSMSQLLVDVVDKMVNLSLDPEKYLLPVYGKKIKYSAQKIKSPQDTIVEEIREKEYTREQAPHAEIRPQHPSGTRKQSPQKKQSPEKQQNPVHTLTYIEPTTTEPITTKLKVTQAGEGKSKDQTEGEKPKAKKKYRYYSKKAN